MFMNLFFGLKQARVPVSLTEYLTLLRAMDARVVRGDVDEFYLLSRACLIKDERHLDRFDRVFGEVFKGLERAEGTGGEAVDSRPLPDEWLRKMAEKYLTPEEKEKIEALGGFDKLMEELAKRLAEQEKRHQGGNRWIGTAGTSPFGAYGYNPEGVRIGQAESRHRRAVKVWDKREFRNLDDSIELGTRNIKVALRRLRKFARTGAESELDLDDTIRSTAAKGGLLDIKMVPERHNAVKVLLFLDVGGSMDDFVRVTEELFSAARTEFKNLEYFYFHNCVYEQVWKDNRRRHSERIDTAEVLRTYPSDYRVIFVGDATMSPYEISHAGGSVEHWNEEAGAVWLQRLFDAYPRSVWLNPTARQYWRYHPSLRMIEQQIEGRMHPMTLEGLDGAMRDLGR